MLWQRPTTRSPDRAVRQVRMAMGFEYCRTSAVGHRFSEGNARDRRRGVAPDAGKQAPLFRRARKDAPALARDQLCRLVHASRAMWRSEEHTSELQSLRHL